MQKRTIVVQGPLAMRMARLDAAARGDNGLHILELSGVAARLAGGFVRPAGSEDLEVAVGEALSEAGYRELDRAFGLPGIARAAIRTLTDGWSAGLAFEVISPSCARLEDIALLDRRVRSKLPRGALSPPDLVDAALARIGHASAIFGTIAFVDISEPARVWHPLLEALSKAVPVEWIGLREPGVWFSGRASIVKPTTRSRPRTVVCPDPRSEAIEAFRWVRALLSSGVVAPREIAIATADPGEWDEHVAALVAETGLPVHFSHGVPALTTPQGQVCAALADILCEGLSQDRMRRLLGLSREDLLGELPNDALRGVPREAPLRDLESWRTALGSVAARSDGFDPLALMPTLTALAAGPVASAALGADLLPRGARTLWAMALRRAPPRALPFTLADLKVADGDDPGATVVWAPASHLAAAPRRFVWLLGLTSGGWPRTPRGDALLPAHLIGGRLLRRPTVAESDRHDFARIAAGADGALVLCRAARSAQGRILSPSRLLPVEPADLIVDRATVPEHACSEADRLLARPLEAATLDAIAGAQACTRGRRAGTVGPHDGIVRADHPAVLRALRATHSATSLTLLLRDPQAFVWRYALGWRSTVEEPLTLALDDRAFGELVHALLHGAMSSLEPDVDAATGAVAAALSATAERIAAEWPAVRDTPPRVLWRHAVDAAVALAERALALDSDLLPGTRKWTELGFGQAGAPSRPGALPWDPAAPVTVPGTGFRVAGSIDRLDLLAGDRKARMSDYKTGKAQPGALGLRLGGGTELQRTVYAIAVLENLPQVDHVVSRLVHLGDDPPTILKLEGVGDAVASLAAYLRAAEDLLRRGLALPGPDASGDRNPSRLALPAATEGYFAVKDRGLRRAFGDFADVWRSR